MVQTKKPYNSRIPIRKRHCHTMYKIAQCVWCRWIFMPSSSRRKSWMRLIIRRTRFPSRYSSIIYWPQLLTWKAVKLCFQTPFFTKMESRATWSKLTWMERCTRSHNRTKDWILEQRSKKTWLNKESWPKPCFSTCSREVSDLKMMIWQLRCQRSRSRLKRP